jgi:hypothetical protein
MTDEQRVAIDPTRLRRQRHGAREIAGADERERGVRP